MAVEYRYLLDTNICIFILDATTPILRERLEKVERGALATSTIALAELLRGIDLKARRELERLEALLAIVPALPFDDAAARAYAALPVRRGRFDRLIAAHALSRGLTLVTANAKDFAGIEGLDVQDWTRE